MAFQEFTPLQYLMIDAANGFGLDKKPYHERLTWFDQNHHNRASLIRHAKDPAHYFAASEAYETALKGEATGHLVSWDATASGLQILAAASCDRKAAMLCNVLDTGNRENAYTLLHEALQRKVGDSARLDPDDVKRAVMTLEQ